MNPIYKKRVASLLANFIEQPESEILAAISEPPTPEQGDYAFPCFTLAKSMRKAPPLIAKELAEKIQLPKEFKKVEALSGYLNFYVEPSAYAIQILTQIHQAGSNISSSHIGQGKTICIDYSSPNLGKELAFHHLRGTMLGASISRIWTKLGYQVVRMNYLGDWGTTYGKLLVMFEREKLDRSPEALAQLSNERLNQLYVAFSKVSASEPELELQAREAFAKLEAGNPEYHRLWLAFRNCTLKELKVIYSILDVDFDNWDGEASASTGIPSVIKSLTEANLLVKSEGAQIVDLSQWNIPPILILKSDGSTLYATRDLSKAHQRYQQYQFDKCLYVTDNGQSLHFQQVFSTLKLLQVPWIAACEFIGFGVILNKTDEGKWEKGKTRTGHASMLKDVLNTAKEKIIGIMAEKNASMENLESTAQSVAVGALVFDMLKSKRLNDVKFEWEKVLSFDGDSGPYVQNAHVRLCSILRKSGKQIASSDEINFSAFHEAEEKALIHLLAGFGDRIESAAVQNDPYLICQYALDLSEKVHSFLHNCRVLGGESEKERLYLVEAARIVLSESLRLVQVPAIEQM